MSSERKKVLVIQGHPREDSFCVALAQEYVNGSRTAGNEVQTLQLADLDLGRFLVLERAAADPEFLKQIHEQLLWADHYVFVFPIWWGQQPAMLKSYFELAFAPDVAFRDRPSKGKIVQIEKLLIGKSARVIATMDSPPWIYRLFIGDPVGKSLKRAILNFCGVKPVKITYLGPVTTATDDQRKVWLTKAEALGSSD